MTIKPPPTWSVRRHLKDPVPELGQAEARDGAAVGIDWVHTGQLGHTQAFMHRPKPLFRNQKGSVPQKPTEEESTSGVISKADGAPKKEPASDSPNIQAPLEAAGGEADSVQPAARWSCCGRTTECAGRGCEPQESPATVRVFSSTDI